MAKSQNWDVQDFSVCDFMNLFACEDCWFSVFDDRIYRIIIFANLVSDS